MENGVHGALRSWVAYNPQGTAYHALGVQIAITVFLVDGATVHVNLF